MAPQPIDYAALAKQAGAVSSTPATSIDYAALAKQAGATSSTPAGSSPHLSPDTPIWNPQTKRFDYPNAVKTSLPAPSPNADQPMGTAATILTAPLRYMQGGLEQTGRGVTRVAHPESGSDFAGGVSDLARGLGTLALPLAAPEMLAAPVTSAVALGSGLAAGAGTEAVLKGLGVPDGYAEMLANVAGAATGMGAGSVTGAITGRGLPKVPSSLNPVEQNAVDFLRQKDVPLDVGTITGNKFVKATQAVVQNSPLGAQAAAEAARGTQAGLTRVAGELADRAHPQPVSPEAAGKSVVGALQQKIQDLQIPENEGYKTAWQGRNDPANTHSMPVRVDMVPDPASPGNSIAQPVMQPVNMPVDVRDIKAQLKPVFEEMQWMPASDRASSAGYQAVKNILEGDDFIPAWQAERGLSGLKAMSRVDSASGVRNVSQGIGAQIIPDLQEQVNAAVAFTSKGDEALRGLQQGRALHASKMEVAELADQLRAEPVQAFNQMTYRNDTGADFLRKIGEQAPDTLPQIGRAYVDQLFDQATREGGFARARTLLNQWQQIGPQTKALLFPDAKLRSGLDNFFKGAEMVAQNPNPSGTALVQSATSINPLRWMAGYVGSKLLFTPRGVALLTRALNPPANPALAQALQENIDDVAAK